MGTCIPNVFIPPLLILLSALVLQFALALPNTFIHLPGRMWWLSPSPEFQCLAAGANTYYAGRGVI